MIIPDVVAQELSRNQDGDFQQAWAAAQGEGWLEILTPSASTLPASVQNTQLDPGETAAIALALELDADLLLIDERAGYKVARTLSIRTLGLLGILLEAKQQGFIEEVKPLLDRLKYEIGFWLSEKLYQRMLRLAGESV